MGRLMIVLSVILVVMPAGTARSELVGHWQFEGDAGDSVGMNDGVMHGGGFTAGMAGQALLLDGVDDYVSLPEYAITTTEFTITSWANHYGPGGGQANKNTIFLQGDDHQQSGEGQSWIKLSTLNNSSASEARFAINSISADEGGTFQFLAFSAAPYEEWHHYAVTVCADYVKVYVDGEEVSSEENLQTGGYINSVDYVDIGRDRVNGRNLGFFNGAIDDLRVYSRALAAEEVQQLYAQVQPRTYHVDEVGGDDANDGLSRETAFATVQKGMDAAVDGDTVLVWPGMYTEAIDFNEKAVTLKSAADAAVLRAPNDYALSFVSGEGPDSIVKNFVITDSNIGLLFVGSSPTVSNVTVVGNYFGAAGYGPSNPGIGNSIFWDNRDGDIFEDYCEIDCEYCWLEEEQVDPNLVAYWKLDGNAVDSAGDNDGTIYGATTVSGRINDALDFDGAGDHVEISDSSTLDVTTFALSLWFKFDSLPDDYEYILEKREAGKDNWYVNFRIAITNPHGDYVNKIMCAVGSGSSSSDNSKIYSNETVTPGFWHNVVYIFDGTKSMMYVDGVLQQDVKVVGFTPYTSGEQDTTIALHKHPLNYGHYFDGLVDDVRIYNRALSAAEVEVMYEAGLAGREYELGEPMFADAAHDDYHLMSERGRYWPAHDVWVVDEASSPCIDIGDPVIEPSNERMPNGGRINAGAYGNTPYASMSEWAMRSDLNRDGVVDFRDFAELSGDWLEAEPWRGE